MIKLHNSDCLEAMRLMEADAFDLAIVDPPYGININVSMGRRSGEKKSNYHKFAGNDSAIPDPEYFQELKRVSKNQIIWGGNYMTDHLRPSPCWLMWDKGFSEDLTFAQFEMAWTSFDSSVRKFTYSHIEDHNKKILRIHPTQKPVALYTWLLEKYAKPNDKILDTHLGSGSIAIACHNLGYDLTGYELDEDYFQKASQRLANHQNQLRLF